MSEYTTLNTKGITPGWEFVNLFHDSKKQIYYCRLRKLEAKKLTECQEITDSGATMQIAFDNTNMAAYSGKSLSA